MLQFSVRSFISSTLSMDNNRRAGMIESNCEGQVQGEKKRGGPCWLIRGQRGRD